MRPKLIAAVVKNKFGWDPVIAVCWLTDSDSHDRLVWQISTQLVWILLAALITTVCALITILYLYKHKVRPLQVHSFMSDPSPSIHSLVHGQSLTAQFSTRRFMNQDASSHNSSSHLSSDKTGGGYRHRLRNRCFMKEATRKASHSLASQHSFRNVIVRIALYPVVMTVVNLIITTGDIRISTAGIFTQADYDLCSAPSSPSSSLRAATPVLGGVVGVADKEADVIYYALYGARGIFYAAMAMVDPSFLRAIRIWRGLDPSVSTLQQQRHNDPEVAAVVDDAKRLQRGISVQTKIVRQEDEIEMSPPLAPDAAGTARTVHTEVSSGGWGASNSSVDEVMPDLGAELSTADLAITATAAAASHDDRREMRELWRARQRLAAESVVNRQI